jgi:hypothetical protein
MMRGTLDLYREIDTFPGDAGVLHTGRGPGET